MLESSAATAHRRPEAILPVSSTAGTAPAAALSTFLITDIEGSTRLWEEHAEAMAGALARHDALLRSAVDRRAGAVIKTTGDGILAVFTDPNEAVAAALDGQRALRDASWGEIGALRVRMAVHSGTAEVRDGDYFGPALNRSARILAIGHGGQILVSAMAATLAADGLPTGSVLRDLGSHRLRDLDRPEQVFQVVVADLPSEFAPLRSLSTRRTNLPVQLTTFVGRERELEEVARLVERHRLVTLIGVGGTGKTRLMLETAGRLVDAFPDGVWLAELAPLGDPAGVASEVARALGAPEVPGQPALDTVQAFVGDKHLLLLLDNAEHLVDEVAGISERLLAAAPRLRILATSREALAVAGEAVFQLRSLSCPAAPGRGADEAMDPAAIEAAAGTEAVRLFLDRAGTVDPGFALGEANVAPVSEICRRLDGIPLAIELAAARVSVMSPDEIAKRLGDRFRLLAGGRRTAVPRQQTLHALIDWSWDLLTEDDRVLLRRLSIFAGGWTIGRAVRIVGDGDEPLDEGELVDRLTRLVDRSLVIVDRGASTRFRMLETIRQYAREKLIASGEAERLADRHFAAFAALAAQAEPELRGPGMVDWLDRLDADVENLDAALEWGLEAAPWDAVRMATDLLGYWIARVPSSDSDARLVAAIEIARSRALGNPDADPADMAVAGRLLGEAARMWAMGGRAQIALGWAQDASILAEASGDVRARLQAAGGLLVSAVFTGGRPDLMDLFAEGIELAAANNVSWMLGMAAGFAGAAVAGQDPDAALVLVLRAEEAARASGNPYVLGAVSMAYGRVLGQLGETNAAAGQFANATARFAEIGDERLGLAARSDLGHALRRGGRFDEAMAIYRETIGGWIHLGHRAAVANQLENIAFLAIEAGRLERAARLLGAAEAIRTAVDAPMALEEGPEYERYVARLRDGLDPTAVSAAWDAGKALSLGDAVTFARTDD
ncbi:MAG TPA: AAA family ATPase [Candidatus Limnocylindrales bacterium]|nr:AAA family ATPase [Candidatus Limnocylindrales bacterium]